MLECTVACSMYLAMPVTKAFLSSKFVSKLACGQSREMGLKHSWFAHLVQSNTGCVGKKQN